MLRNLRIRSKLMLLVLVPLFGLLAFAGLGVSSRLQDAGEAQRVTSLVTVAGRIDELVAALQDERRVSMQFVNEAPGVDVDALEAVRAETETALETLLEGPAAVSLEGESSFAASPELASRDEIRELIDVERTAGFEVDGEFTRMIDSLVAQMRTIGSSLEAADASDDIATLAALTAIREGAARELPLLESAFEFGFFDDAYAGLLGLAAVTVEQEALMVTAMRPEHQSIYAETVRDADVESVRILRQEAITSGGVESLDSSPATWVEVSEAKIALLENNSRAIAADIAARAAAASDAAREGVTLFVGLSAVAVLTSLLLAAIVARQTVGPLLRLTRAAQEISTERLPNLVHTLRTGDGAQSAELVPIGVTSTDEVGTLARAFDEVQATAVQTALDLSALLRRGIGDLFVNLARRNQSLLDRQITVLDQLEKHEDDADALEGLFKLDHLATRMRRNAESLLVLAGAETPRRWRRPVPVEEIIRAAIGEVEDYGRVEVTHIDDVPVSGRAAADLAHLLAELVENATIYSPPSTTVKVRAEREGEGLHVRISDDGLGMADDALAEANRLLADPPMAGFGLTRSLGFVVTGLLARRLGMEVRLERGEQGGVTAHASMPAALLELAMSDVDAHAAAGEAPSLLSDLTASRGAHEAPKPAIRDTVSENGSPPDAAPWPADFLAAPSDDATERLDALDEPDEPDEPAAAREPEEAERPAASRGRRRGGRLGRRDRGRVSWSVPAPSHLGERGTTPSQQVQQTPTPTPAPTPAPVQSPPAALPVRAVSDTPAVPTTPPADTPADGPGVSSPAPAPSPAASRPPIAGTAASPLPVRGGGDLLPRRRPQASTVAQQPATSRLLAAAPAQASQPSDTSDILARYLSTMGGSRNGVAADDDAIQTQSGDDHR